jgi:tetratricopeptide (TPR) repeat protein
MDDEELEKSLGEARNHLQAGRLRPAQAVYRSILADRPDHAEALNLLAIALAQDSQPAEALATMRKAVDVSPNPRSLNNLGVMLMKMDRAEEAIGIFDRALAQAPNYAEAHNNLANALMQTRRTMEAVAAFERAIALKPDYFQAHNNLSYALSMLRRYPEAIAACRKSLALEPDNAQGLTNLGVALEGDGQFDEAIAISQKALQIQPDLPEPYLTLSKAFSEKDQIPEAIAAARKAISLRPDFASAHFNLSTLLLSIGEFTEGWREHESRVKAEHLQLVPREFSRPRWDGNDLAGRRILLHCEQGFGDAIQFVRYAPIVAARGGEVILECRPELVRLFHSVASVKVWVILGQNFPEHDVYYPLLSLPMLFDTTPATIPAAVPYIRAETGAAAAWKDRLAKEPGLKIGPKVGLVWGGSKVPEPDRSIPLEQFAALARIPNVRLISLQKGPAAQEARNPPAGLSLIDWTAELNDFADTAALISQLDLVITIDTSVAHLAGALGKPVWVLLRRAADWRWLLDRADSPWYPTMRLFRQTIYRDWKAPIREVIQQLRRLAEGWPR